MLANWKVDPAVAWIDAAFEGGAEGMAGHLLALGHRRIAHLMEDQNLRSSQGRRAGYERA